MYPGVHLFKAVLHRKQKRVLQPCESCTHYFEKYSQGIKERIHMVLLHLYNIR